MAYLQKPIFQSLLFLIITPLVILIIRPKSADAAWTIAAYAFGTFLVVNAALLWPSDHPWQYFFYSIGSTIGSIVILAMVMQGVLKVLHLDDSEESAMSFLIITYQPFALLMVMLVKWMVSAWL